MKNVSFPWNFYEVAQNIWVDWNCKIESGNLPPKSRKALPFSKYINMIGANLYNHMQLFQICCTVEGALSCLLLLIILKMEGAFKLIAACFKGNSSSSAAAVVPHESCKGIHNDKKKEKLGANYVVEN